jgi:hypothetical protein
VQLGFDEQVTGERHGTQEGVRGVWRERYLPVQSVQAALLLRQASPGEHHDAMHALSYCVPTRAAFNLHAEPCLDTEVLSCDGTEPPVVRRRGYQLDGWVAPLTLTPGWATVTSQREHWASHKHECGVVGGCDSTASAAQRTAAWG